MVSAALKNFDKSMLVVEPHKAYRKSSRMPRTISAASSTSADQITACHIAWPTDHSRSRIRLLQTSLRGEGPLPN